MLQTPRLALVTCIKAAVAGDLFVSGPSRLALRLGRSGQQLLPRAQHEPSMGAFRVRRHPGGAENSRPGGMFWTAAPHQ